MKQCYCKMVLKVLLRRLRFGTDMICVFIGFESTPSIFQFPFHFLGGNLYWSLEPRGISPVKLTTYKHTADNVF